MASPSSAASLSLNQWYITDPQKEAFQNSCYNVAWKTAALVTFVAAAALGSSLVALSFFIASGVSIPTGITILGSLALLAAGPVTQKAVYLWNTSNLYAIEAKKEYEVEEIRSSLAGKYLDQDGALDIDKINKDPTFQQFEITLTDETLSLIQEKLPKPTKLQETWAKARAWAAPHLSASSKKETPNKEAGQAYLRAAARFFQNREIVRRAHNHLLQNKEENAKLPLPSSAEMRAEHWNHQGEFYANQHDYQEKFLLLYTLQTAFFLAILKKPFESTASLQSLGRVEMKSYAVRNEEDKNYFIFNDETASPIETSGLLADAAEECIFEEDAKTSKYKFSKLSELSVRLFHPV